MSFDDRDPNVTEATQTTAAYPLLEHLQSISEFLHQYYDTLTMAPEKAWRNYTVDAQYLHVESNAIPDILDSRPLIPAVGHHQIHSNIVHQQFTECQFHIRSIDIQRMSSTDHNAYLALVIGDMKRDQNQPVMFIQSLLIVVIPIINGHAITNSIFKVNTGDNSTSFGPARH